MRRIVHSVPDLLLRVLLGFTGGSVWFFGLTLEQPFFKWTLMILGIGLGLMGALADHKGSQALAMEGINREMKKRKK